MKIAHIHIFNNVKCCICHVCLPEMIKVGALYLCERCCNNTFKTDHPVRKEREKYLELLHKQNELFEKDSR